MLAGAGGLHAWPLGPLPALRVRSARGRPPIGCGDATALHRRLCSTSAPCTPAGCRVEDVRRALFEDEHEDFRASFRTFLEREVVGEEGRYGDWERAGIMPREVFARAGAGG